MSDCHQYSSTDINLSSTGDILPVSGSEKGKQRVLRRLLTNQGEYVWHPEYGAGVPQMIGRNINIPEIDAVIRGQMKLEAVVSHNPEPVINISPIDNGVFCSIKYVDAFTNEQIVLNFDVTR